MLAPFALAIALLAGPTVDGMGYGSATWGMSLPEVRSLYPGGVSDELGDGLLEYRVLAPFEDGRRSVVRFRFGSTGLTAVLVAFPRREASVNLRSNELDAETDDEAARTMSSVRRLLVHKLGEPFVTDGAILRWHVHDGGWVSLQRVEHGKGYAAIGVLYTSPRLQPDDVPRLVRPNSSPRGRRR